ncbi:dNA polymerase III gamma and tau subunits [Coprobacillus sp. CAG:605]|nr:dNA polymerase III gamma and tau subunits [Coprobacillus sp. CAG:605]
MEYKVLYRKYRPQNFDSLVGQEYTKTLLKNAIKNEHISHAYIFTGPRGTGKTSSAKIFAKALNCLNPKDGNPCNECEMCKSFGTNPDIIEIDAASNNGVDEIREIINNVRLAPANSKYKVYIVDEFHMLSTSAFNALLLTLEEPPSNVVFILATTDIQSVPITVLSRCQRFDFKPIVVDDIVNRLNYVCNEEKIDITDAALKEIAYMSNGGMRDALSILDQISSRNTKIDVDDVTSNFGSISNKKVKEFMDVFTSGDVKGTLELLKEFKNNGIDVRILIEKLIDRIKSILIDIKLDNYNGILDFDMLYSMVFELNRVLQEIKSNIAPYNFLEIVILKYFPGNKISNKDVKAPVEEKKSGSTLKIEQKVEERPTKENISQEIKGSKEPEINNEAPIVNEKKAHFNVDARINNTFVGAQKKYLLELKEKWDDFVIYESNANKLLLSYIVDTELVAASNNYAVLVNKINNTNDLINENIESVEKDFKIFFGREYKLVSISPKVWEEARNKYITNLKSGYKYTMMDDSIIIEENTSELEKLANEIFGNNYETK